MLSSAPLPQSPRFSTAPREGPATPRCPRGSVRVLPTPQPARSHGQPSAGAPQRWGGSAFTSQPRTRRGGPTAPPPTRCSPRPTAASQPQAGPRGGFGARQPAGRSPPRRSRLTPAVQPGAALPGALRENGGLGGSGGSERGGWGEEEKEGGWSRRVAISGRAERRHFRFRWRPSRGCGGARCQWWPSCWRWARRRGVAVPGL